jgi:hypothetical protein
VAGQLDPGMLNHGPVYTYIRTHIFRGLVVGVETACGGWGFWWGGLGVCGAGWHPLLWLSLGAVFWVWVQVGGPCWYEVRGDGCGLLAWCVVRQVGRHCGVSSCGCNRVGCFAECVVVCIVGCTAGASPCCFLGFGGIEPSRARFTDSAQLYNK